MDAKGKFIRWSASVISLIYELQLKDCCLTNNDESYIHRTQEMWGIKTMESE